MALRVLTWNLYHGRAMPPAGRDLHDEFAAALAGWEWDVALLQEVPPWWPAQLAASLRAEARSVLTSRNGLLALRRAVAIRRPDLIKSNGGGANAILVRHRGSTGDGTGAQPAVADHEVKRLCLYPERRRLHAVRLRNGTWVGNLHATVHDDARARSEAAVARDTLLRWAAGAVAVLGGDFNVRSLELDGMAFAGGHDVDLVFAAGVASTGPPEVLERGRLSDHAPVLVSLA